MLGRIGRFEACAAWFRRERTSLFGKRSALRSFHTEKRNPDLQHMTDDNPIAGGASMLCIAMFGCR